MQIVTYPHPTLRHRSKPIKRVDAELRHLVRTMFDLMYEANGVGLAANQVDLPIRLFVANLAARPDEGEELVFINPIISRPKGTEQAEEGCLSLPELYGEVIRPKQVVINAYNLEGEEIRAEVTGLMARVVQHELDHLDGVLFIDRMSEGARADVRRFLEELESQFQAQQARGEVPATDTLLARLGDWEKKYT